jgi:anti-sigma B factor antagonist
VKVAGGVASMRIDVVDGKSFTVVKLDDDIRAKSIIPLRKIFTQLMDEGKSKVALDLKNVRFIDSSGIGILLNFAKQQKEANGVVCLYNYRDDVKELLDIVDFGDFIPIFKDFEEVENAFAD